MTEPQYIPGQHSIALGFTPRQILDFLRHTYISTAEMAKRCGEPSGFWSPEKQALVTEWENKKAAHFLDLAEQCRIALIALPPDPEPIPPCPKV